MASPPIKTLSPNLDLLRGTAVVCVLVAHLLSALRVSGLGSLGSLGRFGVVLFFVHTSFVLMASLERLESRAVSHRRLAAAFWVRRLFRIYPLAVLFVVIVAAFHIPQDPGETYQSIGGKVFFSNLALVQNLTYCRDVLGPLWSLPLEVQMYVLLPGVYLLVRGGGRYRAVLLWVLSVLLATVLPPLSGRLHVFLYAPCFIAGVVAWDLKRICRNRPLGPSWLWPLGIALSILLFGPHDDVSLPVKITRAWTMALAIGVLYAVVAEVPCNWFAHRMQWIAEHSFGIYLSHIVIFWIVIDRMPGVAVWIRVGVCVVATLAVPALLYTFVEQPLTLVGAHVARRLLRPQPRKGDLRTSARRTLHDRAG